MPQYKVDIQKRVGAEYWTNVYWVNASDLGAAGDAAADIVDAEVAIHGTGVTFDKLRVSTVGSPGVFISTGLSGTGTHTLEGTMLPLFNTLNIDFTPEFGRTSKKYLRGCMGEGDIEFDEVSTGILTTQADTYITAILAVAGICDEDGNSFVTGFPKDKVGMRQLRRGSKRRAAPVI